MVQVKQWRALGVVAVIVATVFWSFGGVIGRKSGVSGVVLTFWRMWVATGMFVVIMLVTRQRLPWHAFKRCALAGACFGLNVAAFFTSLEYMSVASALIIASLGPVVSIPIAVLFMHEKLTLPKVVCGAVALAGVVVATWFAPKPDTARTDRLAGYLWAVGSLLLWVTYLLLSKRIRAHVDTVPFLLSVSIFGALALSVAVVVMGEDLGEVQGTGWWWVVLLALIPGLFGHGLVAWAQPRVDASALSLLIQTEPVFASVTAWLFLGETVSLTQAIAMAAVIGALMILAWYETRPSGVDRSVAAAE